MGWNNKMIKEFFKPTRKKIFIFILLMIIISLYVCLQFFNLSCIQTYFLLPDGSWQRPSCSLCSAKATLPFSLGIIIPVYFFACFLVYLGKRLILN